MSFLVYVTHRHRVTLFVLITRSCDKGYVNYITYIYIYIRQATHWDILTSKPHWYASHMIVLSNRSCDWCDLLTKGYVNYIIYIYIYVYIYIYQTSHTLGHSHIKTPLICKSYDLDVDWVVESEVLLIQFSKCCLQNLLFSHIHMWPIEFNENMSGIYWYERFLKHCQT